MELEDLAIRQNGEMRGDLVVAVVVAAAAEGHVMQDQGPDFLHVAGAVALVLWRLIGAILDAAVRTFHRRAEGGEGEEVILLEVELGCGGAHGIWEDCGLDGYKAAMSSRP